MSFRLPATLIPLALLAGCGEKPVAEPTDNDGRTAAGEVVGGTISDAMLPLDTVRSQAPPAVEDAEADAGAPADGTSAPAAATEADEAEPAVSADEPGAEGEADDDAT